MQRPQLALGASRVSALARLELDERLYSHRAAAAALIVRPAGVAASAPCLPPAVTRAQVDHVGARRDLCADPLVEIACNLTLRAVIGAAALDAAPSHAKIVLHAHYIGSVAHRLRNLSKDWLDGFNRIGLICPVNRIHLLIAHMLPLKIRATPALRDRRECRELGQTALQRIRALPLLALLCALTTPALAGTPVERYATDRLTAMDRTFAAADRLATARRTCLTAFPEESTCRLQEGVWKCRAVVANAAGSCILRTDRGIYERFFRPPIPPFGDRPGASAPGSRNE